jgi:hypothetical protein
MVGDGGPGLPVADGRRQGQKAQTSLPLPIVSELLSCVQLSAVKGDAQRLMRVGCGLRPENGNGTFSPLNKRPQGQGGRCHSASHTTADSGWVNPD